MAGLSDGMVLAVGASLDDNSGPTINTANWVLVSLSGIFMGLRLYCKFLTRRGLWWDDHVLIISWLAVLLTATITTTAVSLGLGHHIKDINPLRLPTVILLLNTQGTFSLLAAAWSKTSFALTLLRLVAADSKTKWFLWFVIATVNVTKLVTVALSWARCSPPEKLWNFDLDGSCGSPAVLIRYGIFSGAYSALMDVVLAFLPWRMVWSLQLRMKEKVGVLLAMSMGVFAAGTALVKCIKIPTIGGKDPTYEGTGLLIWALAESAVTITAASLPALRVLIQEVGSSHERHYQPASARKSRLGRTLTTVVGGGRGGGPGGPGGPPPPERHPSNASVEVNSGIDQPWGRQSEEAIVAKDGVVVRTRVDVEFEVRAKGDGMGGGIWRGGGAGEEVGYEMEGNKWRMGL